VLQVKSNYTPLVRKFAQRPLISSGALRTLSYIAYEQPLDSRRLLQIRGSQVYDHVRELLQIGFVQFEKVGRIKIYKTTKKFQIYFGISDFSAMKEKLVISSSIPINKNKS
jgi:segregation and condensation protein B